MIFGNLVACNVLESRAEYETALSPALNYPSFNAALKANEVTHGKLDGRPYVRIYKGDKVMVRSEEAPEWTKNLHI